MVDSLACGQILALLPSESRFPARLQRCWPSILWWWACQQCIADFALHQSPSVADTVQGKLRKATGPELTRPPASPVAKPLRAGSSELGMRPHSFVLKANLLIVIVLVLSERSERSSSSERRNKDRGRGPPRDASARGAEDEDDYDSGMHPNPQCGCTRLRPAWLRRALPRRVRG